MGVGERGEARWMGEGHVLACLTCCYQHDIAAHCATREARAIHVVHLL